MWWRQPDNGPVKCAPAKPNRRADRLPEYECTVTKLLIHYNKLTLDAPVFSKGII